MNEQGSPEGCLKIEVFFVIENIGAPTEGAMQFVVHISSFRNRLFDVANIKNNV